MCRLLLLSLLYVGFVPYLAAYSQHLSECAGQGWSAEDASSIGAAYDTCTASHPYDDTWSHDGRRAPYTLSS